MHACVQALLGFGAQHAVFDWKPELGTSVRVLALDGSGIVRQFSMPPWFSYHFVNTFETVDADLGRCVCVDVPMAQDAQTIDAMYLDAMRQRDNNIPPIQLKCGPAASLPQPASASHTRPCHGPNGGRSSHISHANRARPADAAFPRRCCMGAQATQPRGMVAMAPGLDLCYACCGPVLHRGCHQRTAGRPRRCRAQRAGAASDRVARVQARAAAAGGRQRRRHTGSDFGPCLIRLLR